nr:hypothetical protein [Ferrimicrobium acidiphilum]
MGMVLWPLDVEHAPELVDLTFFIESLPACISRQRDEGTDPPPCPVFTRRSTAAKSRTHG